MPQRVRTHVNPLSITKEIHFEGFGNKNNLIVDIGACKGEFVEDLAKKFPNKNFILLEVRTPLAKKLTKKFEDYDNIYVFDGDAGRNIKNILLPSIKKNIFVEKIFINFPDPWIKKKHKKRRLINEKFLLTCKSFLSPNTEFIFQTDQDFLFEETLEILESHAKIFEFKNSPFGIQTDWEKTKIKEGKKIFRIKFFLKN